MFYNNHYNHKQEEMLFVHEARGLQNVANGCGHGNKK